MQPMPRTVAACIVHDNGKDDCLLKHGAFLAQAMVQVRRSPMVSCKLSSMLNQPCTALTLHRASLTAMLWLCPALIRARPTLLAAFLGIRHRHPSWHHIHVHSSCCRILSTAASRALLCCVRWCCTPLRQARLALRQQARCRCTSRGAHLNLAACHNTVIAGCQIRACCVVVYQW